jgi:glutamyl-tRNA synthetase
MIRTRFAPSPTGSLHIGGLRTALYAYAFAKHEKGQFILRIEDTDKKREIPESLEKIKELLKIFNLAWDEYYVQSERVKTGIYKKAAEKLVAQGNAYKDKGAIRIKIPKNEKVSYHDFVLKKDISWDTNTLRDLVLLKSDGFPTYHLGVVVDDNDMKISHILRGHDWMPSTPIHLLIYKYLGYKLPEIGHLTDILDPEGGKLSKRKGSTSVEGLLKEGYLPDAILNFVMLLGWAPKDNKELFTLDEFVTAFNTKGFQKSNPIFNREKLDWFNGQYIRKLSNETLTENIFNFYDGKYPKEIIAQLAPLVKDRIKKLSDFANIAGFFFEEPVVDKNLFGKNYKEHIQNASKAISENNDFANIDLTKVVDDNKFKTGDFFMDLRIAISGKRITPPFNESIKILGKKETLRRLGKVLK